MPKINQFESRCIGNEEIMRIPIENYKIFNVRKMEIIAVQLNKIAQILNQQSMC